MAAVEVDAGYLAGYLEVAPTSISTVLDSPTTDLVRKVLEAVAIKAQQHDEVIADKLRLEIELDNAVRGSETRVEGLKSTLEQSRKTTAELRTKLTEAENARSALETELQAAKSSSTSSTSEVETLKARINSLESANRDTMAVVEAKTTANDSLAQDLQKQHQKTLELTRQVSTHQQAAQNAESALASAKFKEQSLAQELALVKRNNEWFEEELKSKAADALKFRKEKGARLAELQRTNEEANANIEALKRGEQGLRTRMAELQQKAEESLQKIQQLREDAVSAEENSRQEVESSRRLAEIRREQLESSIKRIEQLEAQLQDFQEAEGTEKANLQQEIDEVVLERDRAQRRVAELEADLDNHLARDPATSQPSTPYRGQNGTVIGSTASPMATPGSLRKAATNTELTQQLHATRFELKQIRRKYAALEAETEEIIRSAEAKGPELQEQQEELDRLQHESIEMSKFLDQLTKDRETARKDYRRAENEATNFKAESNILRQQLRDQSAQIKMLIFELDARERGMESLTSDEHARLERLARGEDEHDALEGMTDTDRFISQRLTVFRTISDLQEKNQELLRVTRELGAKMESEEALAAKHQAAEDHQAVQDLQEKVENYRDELQSMITRCESYMKERDMFRRMLQHRGHIPPDSDLASMFGQSTNSHFRQSTDGVPPNRDGDFQAALRELQRQYDQYREESTVDRRTLKDQIATMAAEKTTLQAEIAKISSQLSFASERHEMLSSNYKALQTENSELQKRTQILSEASAKQDLRTQQVAEDLIESKGLVESMRNENANLKAEKTLWKGIQDRLSQDLESLTNERNRLNGLITSQQNLLNERQLAESESRRRLEKQIESLETELATTRRNLSDEVESHKNDQLRREYDSQQAQKRIEDLVTTISSLREEMVATKTSRDHLQARVDELVIGLRSAEERVVLLQPKPTPRARIGSEQADVAAPGMSLDKEQELSIEISELKRDVDLAKSELESAREQMEQYKAISQASEEELQSLNATQDAYREEMDRVIAEKETKIRELQQRLEDISTELNTTNTELTNIRGQQSDISRQAEADRLTLVAEVTRLKDDIERHSTTAQFHQEDLRAQAAIATTAQRNYETELVKHAEATKQLQALRAEYNQLRTEAATLRADAEGSKATLQQDQASWEDRKAQFSQEMDELRRRRDDVTSQNKLLQQQLESFSSQISALQQTRGTGGASSLPGADAFNDRNADGLRELNAFLRREKEIVEVQFDLKVQEAKRLQQKLQYTESQLDESRLKLDQERRAHADAGLNSASHNTLMQKLNELNLLRESNITLRNELRQTQGQLTEKSKRVDELVSQIQPLEIRLQEFEHNVESLKGEHNLMEEDRNHWRKRTEDILSKYDRIDPAEMEKLQESLKALEAQRDALSASNEPLEEKVKALEGEKAAWLVSRQKIIEQAKERNRTLTKDKNDRAAERDAAIQERDSLQQQLSPLQEELASTRTEKSTLEQNLAQLQEQLDKNLQQGVNEVAADDVAPTPQSDETNRSYIQQIETLQKSLETVNDDKQALSLRIEELDQQLTETRKDRDEAHAAVANSAQDAPQDQEAPSAVTDDARNTAPAMSAGMADAERKQFEDRIALAEQKLLEQQSSMEKMQKSMDATVKERSDKMKALVNERLRQSQEKQKKALEEEYKLKFEQDKQIWLAETQHNKALPQQQTDSSAVTEKPAALPAQETAKAAEQTASTAIPSTHIFDPLSFTVPQVQELMTRNPVAKQIVSGNIKNKVAAELQQRVEAAKAEMEQKCKKEKETERAMVEKKVSVQLNMARNQYSHVSAKWLVVERAAKDTPQKAVVEVYNVAKDAKPAQNAPPASSSGSTGSGPNGPAPTGSTGSVPVGSAASGAAATDPVPTGSASMTGNKATTPAKAVASKDVKIESKLEQPKSSLPQAATQPQNAANTAAASSTPAAATPTTTNNPLPNADTVNVPAQPSAAPAARQSGIPRGGAAGGRGRAGGSLQQRGGRGRGVSSPQQSGPNAAANTTAQNAAGHGAPSGQKRGREDGPNQQGNGAKRQRG